MFRGSPTTCGVASFSTSGRAELRQLSGDGLVIDGDDGVVVAVVTQTLVGLDARVRQRRVLAAEGEDGLVHVRRVEDAEVDEQEEVSDAQACYGLEQIGFWLGDDVLEGVFRGSP